MYWASLKNQFQVFASLSGESLTVTQVYQSHPFSHAMPDNLEKLPSNVHLLIASLSVPLIIFDYSDLISNCGAVNATRFSYDAN